MTPAAWFLADDLSGALEIAAAGAGVAGRPLEVVFGGGVAYPPDGDGVSTETRNLPPAAARRVVADLLDRRGPGGLWFKKIDSTLRGPVGAELAALLARPDARPVLFCPAGFAAGRTVRGGRVFVDGVPLEETAFARDPLVPVAHGAVAALVAASGGPAVAEVGLDTIRGDPAVSRRALAAGWAAARVVSVDATTPGDLERVLVATRDVAPDFLPVGASGLHRALLPPGSSAGRIRLGRRARFLFVVGSVHPVSRAQLQRLEAATGLRAGAVGAHLHLGETVAAVAAGLARSGLAAITTGPVAESAGDRAADAQALAQQLGAAVRALHEDGAGFDALFVTGGDVAREVLSALGVDRVRVEGGFEPGVAVGRVEVARGRGLSIVVKPGGFGAEDLLVRLARAWGRAG